MGIEQFDAIQGKQINVNTGSGIGELEPSGMVYSNFASTANVSTGETDLGSYIIAANSMPASSGKAVRVMAWGKMAANGNNKTITIKFGAKVVATHALAATNDKDWVLKATIIQGTTGAQTSLGELKLEGASQDLQLIDTPAETETGAIVVACYGTSGTASADILLKGMTVEFLN